LGGNETTGREIRARKKEEAIAALLTQRNIEEAAKVAGIGANTLLRWLKVPEFQTAYREARRAAFGQSIARLQQATGMAVSVLLKVMVDSATPASVKVRAADSVLDHSAKAIEIEDIEARLSELERAAEASKSDRKVSSTRRSRRLVDGFWRVSPTSKNRRRRKPCSEVSVYTAKADRPASKTHILT
jgi:hypothetical protein